MIVITFHVSGVTIPPVAGAEKFEPLFTYTSPLQLMEPEDVMEKLREALAHAVHAINAGNEAGKFDRVNLTVVFEHLPGAGFFVLEFKVPESEQKEITDRKPELN